MSRWEADIGLKQMLGQVGTQLEKKTAQVLHTTTKRTYTYSSVSAYTLSCLCLSCAIFFFFLKYK